MTFVIGLLVAAVAMFVGFVIGHNLGYAAGSADAMLVKTVAKTPVVRATKPVVKVLKVVHAKKAKKARASR